MTIEILRTDIFKANTQAVVNPVNTHGVMGAGLALKFKLKYPDMFEHYKKLCVNKAIQIGEVSLYQVPARKSNLRYIFLFPTKIHWSHSSRLDDIVKGMRSLRVLVNHHKIKSLAIPAVGCGLGNLVWTTVLPVIVGECRNMENCEVKIYEPR